MLRMQSWGHAEGAGHCVLEVLAVVVYPSEDAHDGAVLAYLVQQVRRQHCSTTTDPPASRSLTTADPPASRSLTANP